MVKDLSQAEEEGGSGTSEKARLLERAALAAAGEYGYRHLTVKKILDRAQVSRALFYRLFANKSDCYASAVAHEIEDLRDRVLQAGCGRDGWPAGFRAGLEVIAEYLARDPLVARGLLLEIHVAGGSGLQDRQGVFERLAEAIDTARNAPEARQSPPPITALFVTNMVEAAICRSLLRTEPRAFEEAISPLVFIAVSLYFGPDFAEANFNC